MKKLLVFTLILLTISTWNCKAQGSERINTAFSNAVTIIKFTITGRAWVGFNGAGCSIIDGPSYTTLTNFSTANTPMECDTVGAIELYPIGGVLHSFMGTCNGLVYKHGTVWDSLTGLPNRQIAGIVKSKNDSLWVGSQAGVSLYIADTLRHVQDFNTGNSTIPSNAISCLQSNQSGCDGYAAGTNSQGYFYTADGGSYTQKTVASGGLANDTVNCIHVTPGCLVDNVGTKNGLSICARSGSCVNYHTSDGLPDNDITSLTADCRGKLWIGTREGGASVFDGTSFRNLGIIDGLPSMHVSTIRCDSSCNCWIGTRDAGIVVLDTLYRTVKGFATGVENVSSGKGPVLVYPQPAADNVNFIFTEMIDNGYITVTDLTGRVVARVVIDNWVDRFALPVNDLATGAYLFELSDAGKRIQTGKFSVLH